MYGQPAHSVGGRGNTGAARGATLPSGAPAVRRATARSRTGTVISPCARQDILAADREARGAQFVLDDGIDLLDDEHVVHAGGEPLREADRQRVRQPELHDRRVRTGLAHDVIGRPGNDEAEAAVGSGFQPVPAGGLRLEGERAVAPGAQFQPLARRGSA